jgi:hypothetical protein
MQFGHIFAHFCPSLTQIRPTFVHYLSTFCPPLAQFCPSFDCNLYIFCPLLPIFNPTQANFCTLFVHILPIYYLTMATFGPPFAHPYPIFDHLQPTGRLFYTFSPPIPFLAANSALRRPTMGGKIRFVKGFPRITAKASPMGAKGRLKVGQMGAKGLKGRRKVGQR